MSRKILKRLMLTLAILIVAYPVSFYPFAWWGYRYTVPESLWEFYHPLIAYHYSRLPGSKQFHDSVNWFVDLGPEPEWAHEFETGETERPAYP
jgi:hypothetical protein